MKTTREIQEQIDALAIEGQAIYDAARSANREMAADELARFDDISDKLVPQLRKEFSEAEQREAKIRQLSQAKHREQQAQSLGTIIEDGLQRNTNRAILPINGEEMGNDGARQDCRVYSKVAKLKAFKSDRDAFNVGMWMRAVIGKEYNRTDVEAEQHCQKMGWRLTNAGVEGSGALGGYLVPAPLSQTIIDVRERVGVMRQLLNVLPMTSDTLTVVKRSGGLTVYGGNEAPSSDMTSSDKSWKQVKLVADKRYVVHQISQELTEDAIINVVDDAVLEMAYALALAEDTEAISGDGTSTYRGVTGIAAAIGSAGVFTASEGDHDSWPELTISDFTNTMAKLPSRFWNGEQLSWLCSSAFYYGVMLALKATAGGNTISTITSGDGRSMPEFLGHPVYFSDRMPTATATSSKCAYFGNWRQLGILGDRGGVRVARSDDFAFLRDMTTLKATTRYDIVLHEPGNDAAAGAVVALATNS